MNQGETFFRPLKAALLEYLVHKLSAVNSLQTTLLSVTYSHCGIWDNPKRRTAKTIRRNRG